MMYKATRPDGTDFRTGTVDYAAALVSGETVKHPFSTAMVANEPATYLSVSVEKAETLIGGEWPCRLFEVEPVGSTLDQLEASPHKRACLELRMVRELPAWEALGPNGRRVAAVIERCRRLTATEARDLGAAWDAAWGAAWDAGWDAGWGAAWGAARDAARVAARDVARDVARDAAWGVQARDAAWVAAWGEAVRDLITPDHYELLAGPWLSVIGPVESYAPEVER